MRCTTSAPWRARAVDVLRPSGEVSAREATRHRTHVPLQMRHQGWDAMPRPNSELIGKRGEFENGSARELRRAAANPGTTRTRAARCIRGVARADAPFGPLPRVHPKRTRRGRARRSRRTKQALRRMHHLQCGSRPPLRAYGASRARRANTGTLFWRRRSPTRLKGLRSDASRPFALRYTPGTSCRGRAFATSRPPQTDSAPRGGRASSASARARARCARVPGD